MLPRKPPWSCPMGNMCDFLMGRAGFHKEILFGLVVAFHKTLPKSQHGPAFQEIGFPESCGWIELVTRSLEIIKRSLTNRASFP